ncbi:MAG: DUF927 domain-containing protein [Clostridia bacterium]|nr:DUF927 domain-containing protein [Clostridia bacterium]
MLYYNQQNGCMDFVGKKNQVIDDVSPAFKVTKITRQLEMGKNPEQITILVNDYNQSQFDFTLTTTDIYGSNLLSTLASNKLVVMPYMEQSVQWYLHDGYQHCRKNGIVEYYHNQLGWLKHQGTNLYLMDTNKVNGHTSTTTRNMKFKAGSKADYQKFLQNVVYPCKTLTLAMAIGYSAPVASLLKDERDIGTIVVNLCGSSSTGKTTAEQLMVSPFACPDISNKQSLVRTFHATQNAIFAGIDGIHGLPIVLDDITTNPNMDAANLVYTIASGEQKGRCDTSGQLKEQNYGWSGTVIISSETPIEELNSENQGLKARVLQTQGIVWTPDAETATLIKSTVLKHYGHTGREFAEYVGNIPLSTLCDRFDAAQKIVHGIMKKRDNLSDRLELKYTTICLTLQLMKEYFSIELDEAELMSILLQPEQDRVLDRDIAKKGIELIKDFVIQKVRNFNYVDERTYSYSVPQNCDDFGTIEQKKGQCHVYIATAKVEEVLRNGKIAEVATVKNKWKEQGLTVCDNGRNDCKKFSRRCVHFVFDTGLLNDAGVDTSHWRQPAEDEQPQPPVVINNDACTDIAPVGKLGASQIRRVAR